MSTRRTTRFDAQSVVRLATLNGSSRFEMQFVDASGEEHIVSLPTADAIELGRLICDVAERAPYLIPARSSTESQK